MSQTRFCEHCGASLAPEVRFCESCGQPIAATPPSLVSTPPPTPDPRLENRGLIWGLVGLAAILVTVIAVGVAMLVRSSQTAPVVSVNLPASTPVPTAILAAAHVPTSTNPPPQTPTPTNPPRPTVSPSNPPPAEDGIVSIIDKLLLSADFDKPATSPSGTWAGENDQVKRYFESGEFHMQLKGAESHNWMVWLPDQNYSDFALETDARFVDGPSAWTYGLIFRHQAGNFYLYLFGYNGDYVLDKYVNGQWQRLKDWTGSPYIKTNEANHLRVICRGSEIAMYVNDQYLGVVTDDMLSAGAVGLYVQGQPNMHVAFDNLKVWSVR